MVYKIDMGLQETFIENLKFYRKKSGISQKDLSIALNKGFNYINSIECGVSFPPPAIIDEVAGILGIEPETLFSKSASPANILASYSAEFSKSLKEELTLSISREIERICDRIGK